MKINNLSKSDTSEIFSLLKDSWKIDLPKQKTLKIHEVDDNKFLVVGENLVIVKVNEFLLPFLNQEELLKFFPSVFVDMGAVKFVCNGAKIMRPGIVRYDSFDKNQLIIVRDEIHSKALAVGLALIDSVEMPTISKGYVIENIHFITDKFWQRFKELFK